MYADGGRVETISGVIDQTTGAVNVRALFPNKHNILRSGGTGKRSIPQSDGECNHDSSIRHHRNTGQRNSYSLHNLTTR